MKDQGPFEDGINIDNYIILKNLGSGKMGWSYLAFDKEKNKVEEAMVVLKVMAISPDLAANNRFESEALIAKNIHSAYSAMAYDEAKRYGNFLYYPMEYVSGVTLETLIHEPINAMAWLKAKPLDFCKVLSYSLEIAKALNAAENIKCVHRDLHPGNIIVGKDGKCKIIDWGMGKQSISGEYSVGTFKPIGASSYCALEKWEDPSHVSIKADLYSLGVIMYRSITLRYPYWAKSSIELYNKIKDGKYTPIEELVNGVPLPAQRFIDRILSNDKRIRPNSALECISLLENLIEEIGIKIDRNDDCDPYKYMKTIENLFPLRIIVRQEDTKNDLDESKIPEGRKAWIVHAMDYIGLCQRCVRKIGAGEYELFQCPHCHGNVRPTKCQNGVYFTCDRRGGEECFFWVAIFYDTYSYSANLGDNFGSCEDICCKK